jgi:hypothetical protein
MLWLVVGMSLAFTAANVTRFAVHHDIGPWIAWLLDPIASLALIAMLTADGVLARHGRRAGGWAAVVKFLAGSATWAMNVWSPVAAGDPAGVLMHSVAPALVIGLAEATPRVQIRFADLAEQLDDRAAMVSGSSIQAPGPPVSIRRPIDGGGPTGSDPLTVPDAAVSANGSAPRQAAGRSDREPAADARPRRDRSFDDHRIALRKAIAAGDLYPVPTAEAIREQLAIAPRTARILRDEITEAAADTLRRLANDASAEPDATWFKSATRG